MNRLIYAIKYILIFSSFTLLLPLSSQAKTLFEAYYKILSNNVHIGYMIQRYSYNKSKKQFESIYLIRTNKLAGNAFESLKAYASDTYKPISYQYSLKAGKIMKTIDAQFTKNTMTAVISDGRKKNTVQKNLKKGTFLSSFLGYLMLSKGLSENTQFNYRAIVEEDAQDLKGSAKILSKDTYKGIPVFKMQNTFKKESFTSFITHQAQVLYVQSNQKKLSTQLVATPLEATQGQNLSEKSIKALFGNIPLGKANSISRSAKK